MKWVASAKDGLARLFTIRSPLRRLVMEGSFCFRFDIRGTHGLPSLGNGVRAVFLSGRGEGGKRPVRSSLSPLLKGIVGDCSLALGVETAHQSPLFTSARRYENGEANVKVRDRRCQPLFGPVLPGPENWKEIPNRAGFAATDIRDPSSPRQDWRPN